MKLSVPLPLARRSASEAPAAPIDDLQTLLQQDEGSFIRAALDVASPQMDALLRSKPGQSLFASAIAGDQANALMVLRTLRPHLAPWRSNPYTDAKLAQRARDSLPPRICATLHRHALLDYSSAVTALARASRATLAALGQARLIDSRMVGDATLARLVPFEPDELRQLRRDGLLHEAVYCRVAAPRREPALKEALLTDAVSGLVTPEAVLAYLAPTAAEASEWTRKGLLSAEVLLAHFEAIPYDSLRALHARALLTPQTLLQRGAATPEEAVAWAEDGIVTAENAARSLGLPGDVLSTWYEAKRISADAYAESAARSWKPFEPLPAIHVLRVRASADLHATLRALPQPEDPALRRSFLLRLNADAIEALATTRAAAPPTRTLPASTNAKDEALCLACASPLSADAPAKASTGCDHPVQFHAACLRQAFDARLEQGLPPQCPTPACSQPTTLRDGLEMGLTAEQLDSLAFRIVATHRPPNWHICPTEGCCGGIVVPNNAIVVLDCAHCEKSTRFDGRAPGIEKVREVLIAALDGMGSIRPRNVRSCYACGVATERESGCDNMLCGADAYASRSMHRTGCGNAWNFVTGPRGQPYATDDGSQTYVPKAGDLVRAGLFAPLAPGYVQVRGVPLPGGARTIQDLARSNALAKGWIRMEGGRWVLNEDRHGHPSGHS